MKETVGKEKVLLSLHICTHVIGTLVIMWLAIFVTVGAWADNLATCKEL